MPNQLRVGRWHAPVALGLILALLGGLAGVAHAAVAATRTSALITGAS